MNTPAQQTVLVSGFGPFGEFADNPSEYVASNLSGTLIGNHRIHGIILPVVFGEAAAVLTETIQGMNPDIVICLGLAADRDAITPERIAINLIDAGIPDNAGSQPVDKPVLPDGAPSYWSTLPVSQLVAMLQGQDVPAKASLSAGAFVCNEVFYRLMHQLKDQKECRAGFIHLPLPADPRRPDMKGMTLDEMVEAIRGVVTTLVQSNPESSE